MGGSGCWTGRMDSGGAIHLTKIQTGPTGKSGPPQNFFGPVFSKLFRLDRTDPLSFGPKFTEILVEWIAPWISPFLYLTSPYLTSPLPPPPKIKKLRNQKFNGGAKVFLFSSFRFLSKYFGFRTHTQSWTLVG